MTPGKQRRYIRSWLALRLQKTPAEIDAMPETDKRDVIAVWNEEQRLLIEQQEKAKAQRKR